MRSAGNRRKNPDDRRELFFLILSCSGGAGHIRAAEALHRAAPLSGLPIRTEHYDVLDFTSKLFKRLYSESYLQMVNRAPELWGYLYQHSESKAYEKKGLLKAFDRMNYKRYLAMLRKLHPDAILCTHFLPYVSVSRELRPHGIASPIFAVTTDFDLHQLWVDQIVRRYFVFHEETAWQLQAKGVAKEKIAVTGIPVMPEFARRRSRLRIGKAFGLDKKSFTVLILSGGFGIGRVESIVQTVAQTLGDFFSRRVNLIIVCGKNEKAKANLEKTRFPPNIRSRCFGFVSTIHELMDDADILISKSGGLTSSEALAKSLPMLIVDPIPGQESRNADILVEHGAGWKAINLPNLAFKLRRILECPEMLRRARNAAATLAKPLAAQTILHQSYELLRQSEEVQP
jgi:processive 1,2-diacylglycerol beta-glucosyltransferase